MSKSEMEPPTAEQLAEWSESQTATEREHADAAAATPAVAHSTGRRGGWRIPAPVLFALPVLLAVGAGVASALLVPRAPKKEEEPAARAEAPVPPPAAELEVISTLVRAGCYSEALAMCKASAAQAPDARRSLAYREAVCLEALGRLKEAGAAYRRAELTEGNHAASARAVLGQARCAVAADDLTSAQNLLDRVVLRSGHPDCAGTHVFEECLFLRARLDALRLGPVRALDPLDPDAVAWPALSGALDRYAEWLPPDTPPAGSVGTTGGPSAEAHRAAGAAGGFEVTVHLGERPVADALRALAAAAGLKLQTDAATAAAMAKEVVALDVEGMPLGDVLGALVGRFGAGWKVEGDVLTVAPAEAVPGDRLAVAKSFRRALAAAPAHPRALAVRVWLANFEFVAGRGREAAKEYQNVLDTAPEAPEVPHAVYNLGLAELRAGALQSARSRFVDLVDRAPRTRWAEYGWWWVGRTHLDVGDRAAAKRAFQTALGGRTREVTSAAAIGICACELLDGKDEPARAALGESRLAVREEHIALGTLFEALLRYRAGPTAGRRTELSNALRAAADGRALGPGGAYLVGRVYRDLGQPEKTAALYDAATESIRGPLAVRMTFDAAEWYDLSERRDAARQRYLAVAATDPKGLGPKAELKLAGMALRNGNADECVRRCRALIDRPGVERLEVLSLMGRGYEVRRNYRLAAECFGGRVPVE